jgi:hypothetical protein
MQTMNTKKELSLKYYINTFLSFRYLSNISIIVCFLSYYMRAYEIFLTFIPLVIVNFIVINIVQIFNFDELIEGTIGKVLPDKKDRDSALPQFVFFNSIWHLIPIFWIYYILQSQNLINIFRPNFMSIFFKSSLLVIIYYYFEVSIEIYGKINYELYLILYIIILLTTCLLLFDNYKY